jgi:hypothetical protein
MRRFVIFLFISVLCCLRVYPQSVQQANIWFDSEQSSQPQSQDKSSLQKSVLQQDSVVLLNFHSVKSFTESVSPLQMPHDISRSSRLTVIVVFHSQDTVSEHGIWSVFRGGEQVTGLTDRRLLRQNSEYVYPVKRRGIPLINTSMQSFSKIRAAADSNHFELGAALLPDSTFSSFSGDIAECLVFDRFLKRAEALKFETYLAIKYGVTLIESDYVSSSGAVLWNYEENKKYSNGIAGLGKDNVLGLNQKQGCSSEEDGLLTISVGAFSQLNRDNDYVLHNEDFIVWGHNEGGLVFEPVLGSDTQLLLARKWLIQSTYTAQRAIFPTTIKFLIPEQYRDSSRLYYLAIDRSGTGDFTSKSVEYIASERIDSDGYIYFTDILWDADGSGKDVFSFSYNAVLEDDEPDVEMEKEISKESDKQTNRDKKEVSAETAYPSYILYPNPTTGHYRLEADFPEITSVILRVCTPNGVVLETRKDAGKTQYIFDGYIEVQGSYLLEIESIFGVKSFRLSVVK